MNLLARASNPVFGEEGESDMEPRTALMTLVVLFGFARVMQARTQGDRVWPQLLGVGLVIAVVLRFAFYK